MGPTQDAARDGRKEKCGVSMSWLRFPPPNRWLLDAAFSLAQQPIAFCLGTGVPATCRTFGSCFLFRHFFSLRPLSVNSFFARVCSTRCAACFGDVTIAVAYCKPPCTIHHRLGVCWSLTRSRVSWCSRPVFPLVGYNRTSGRASCSFTELYCPMWCGEYRRSVMCVSVLCRFWKGNIHGKITW